MLNTSEQKWLNCVWVYSTQTQETKRFLREQRRHLKLVFSYNFPPYCTWSVGGSKKEETGEEPEIDAIASLSPIS
jgi:hypothetical protein